MRLRNNPQADDILGRHESYIQNPKECRGKWFHIFKNENPIYIEIGMGKGDFIINNALKYPHINFIGIEKYPTVQVKAIRKIDKMDTCPKNLRLMSIDALELLDVFDENEIDGLYLNFSDPWPKERHAKRRLTSQTFLPIYRTILKDDCSLVFKTDNRNLFEFSIMTFNQEKMKFHDICLDLHHSLGYEDNIMTEYERKFSPHGPIYLIECQF